MRPFRHGNELKSLQYAVCCSTWTCMSHQSQMKLKDAIFANCSSDRSLRGQLKQAENDLH